MFFHDDKKMITTVMSKRGPKGGEHTQEPTPMKPEVMKDEDGEMDGRHLAAQDIMAAHHSQSPAKLKEAMGNFIDLHMAHGKGE